jgi:hypothetical protein
MLRKLIAPAVVAGALVASSADAQAWNYPALQTPTVSREYNFVVADGDDAFGTSFVFQWRNPMGVRSQLSLDGGMADTDADTYLLLGGTYGYQLARARRDMPIDVLLTAGLNGAFGDGNLFRIPVGVSVGHRFPLEGRLAITPYAHPRLSIDHCGDCVADETEIGIAFDFGADIEFSPQLAMRVAVGMGGSDFFEDQDAIGISLAWSPAGARSGGPRRR